MNTINAYFDTGIKEDRENYFNYEKEVDELKKVIENDVTRLILITGMRRVGKSSLVNVVLNDNKYPYIWIDSRELGETDIDSFYKSLEDGLSEFLEKNTRFLDKIRNIFRSIKGVSVTTPLFSGEVKVDINEKKLYTISKIFKKVSKYGRVVLVIDEAQNFNDIKGFDGILAFMYDQLKNVKIIMTGSELSLIDILIGKKNPKAALFGRIYHEINLAPLLPDNAVCFLEKGFEQEGVLFKKKELEEIINSVNGIPGWLVDYGYSVAEKKMNSKEAINNTLEKCQILFKSELDMFLETKEKEKEQKKYLAILTQTIKGANYDEIKSELQKDINKDLTDTTLRKSLAELNHFGFIRKNNKKYETSCIAIKRAIEDDIDSVSFCKYSPYK